MRQTQTRFGMRRLSASGKPCSGRYTVGLMAVVMVLAFAVGGCLIWRNHNAIAVGMMAAWVPQMVMVLTTRGRRLLAPGLVDEVWLEDGDLLLNRKEQSARTPLRNVTNVVVDRRSNFVTLELGMPCGFGDQVRFIARPRSAHDIGVALRQRIAEARQSA